jgi:predicted 3-demethylubiquinone-9 3-methyltransferase (glyoxalase superfamily)
MASKAKKLATFLWFDGQAEEAAKFYCSVFKGAKLGTVMRWPAGMEKAGQVLTAEFRAFGQDFVCLNGGPEFKFNESVSFSIPCETQKEIDYYWERLLAGGGRESACGWLKDKYGVSWQVDPPILLKLIKSKDQAKAKRVMEAMMKMVKIDIAKLQAAAKGKA